MFVERVERGMQTDVLSDKTYQARHQTAIDQSKSKSDLSEITASPVPDLDLGHQRTINKGVLSSQTIAKRKQIIVSEPYQDPEDLRLKLSDFGKDSTSIADAD